MTYAPSFTDMQIENNAYGIYGSQVNGLTLDGCTVSGNGIYADDSGLDFSLIGTRASDGLTGTVSITNSTITGSSGNNATINDTGGTLDLTVADTTFSNDNASTGNDGLDVDADGATNATISIIGSTFTNNVGDAFQFSTDSAATGTDSVMFSSNTLKSTVAGILGGGVDITPDGNSNTTISVDANNIQNPVGDGIEIDEDGTTGTLSGAVSGNTIGAPTTIGSGGGTGIGVSAEGSATETLAITGNALYQYSDEAGINFINHEGHPVMNLTITGNTVTDPGAHAGWGIHGQAGAQTTDNGTVCAAINGNSVAGAAQAGQAGADIELDQNDATTFEVPGYTGAAGDTSAVESFLAGGNYGDGKPTANATVSGSGGGFVGVSSC